MSIHMQYGAVDNPVVFRALFHNIAESLFEPLNRTVILFTEKRDKALNCLLLKLCDVLKQSLDIWTRNIQRHRFYFKLTDVFLPYL